MQSPPLSVVDALVASGSASDALASRLRTCEPGSMNLIEQLIDHLLRPSPEERLLSKQALAKAKALLEAEEFEVKPTWKPTLCSSSPSLSDSSDTQCSDPISGELKPTYRSMGTKRRPHVCRKLPLCGRAQKVTYI